MRTDGEPREETVISSRVIHRGRIISVREDTVALGGGGSALREIVEHAGVVAVVPVDINGEVVLVRQYRLPAQEVLLEIPAGCIDEGEDAEAAAQRELQEETGYRAERLRRLTGFFVSPGYCTEFIHIFLATGLRDNPLDGDADEEIAVRRMPLAEAVRMVEAGEIKDGKSIAGLLLAARRLAAGEQQNIGA